MISVQSQLEGAIDPALQALLLPEFDLTAFLTSLGPKALEPGFHAEIEALAQTIHRLLHLRASIARLAALKGLENATRAAETPIETRRAATALLRATCAPILISARRDAAIAPPAPLQPGSPSAPPPSSGARPAGANPPPTTPGTPRDHINAPPDSPRADAARPTPASASCSPARPTPPAQPHRARDLLASLPGSFPISLPTSRPAAVAAEQLAPASSRTTHNTSLSDPTSPPPSGPPRTAPPTGTSAPPPNARAAPPPQSLKSARTQFLRAARASQRAPASPSAEAVSDGCSGRHRSPAR